MSVRVCHDEIFAAAAKTMQAQAHIGPDTEFADSDAECQAVVAKLKETAADSQ